MVWVAILLLTLWLGGLTWYVALLALAPIPVQDVHAALRQLAASRVQAVRSTKGRDLLRARLEARRAPAAPPASEA